MATGCALHLIHPLGFSTEEKALRRAGLDYWPRLNVSEHDNWHSFVEHELCAKMKIRQHSFLNLTPMIRIAHLLSPNGTRVGDVSCDGDLDMEKRQPAAWLLTTHARAKKAHWEADFAPGDFLLFGSETRGAADEVHEWVGDERRIALPMVDEARSINLAAAVSAALYEAMRQVESR